ncbi:hypothetical protein POM88_023090 [Heracleum sosnowskyi]|uniref:CCHC-type domain-containing protein n=1 Tax=Heracleum sosnowskyi TaxID=360622 RepID=A0AAD8IGL4_9APIA|nr:hypothetical protein POM88_023090 [Heracleum sosnowskyi]
MSQKDHGVKIPVLDRENYFHWKVKMRLHLMSMDEAYVECIEHGPHVPMKPNTSIAQEPAGAPSTIPKLRSEWTPEDIVAVHKEKKAMNILFNGLDSDMFDNVINCSTAKEIWDTVQTICEGTEKDYTLERLYGTLKTYELEIEQDEEIEKVQKKIGSVALVASVEKDEDMKEEVAEATPSQSACESRAESRKCKGKMIKESEPINQEEMDELDDHLAFLSRKFSKLKFKRNPDVSRPFKNDLVDRSKFKCFNCGMGGHFANECRKPKSEKSDMKFEPVDYKKKYFDLLKQKGKVFITQDYDWAEDGNDLEEDTKFMNLALMADSSEQEASSSSNQVITINLTDLSTEECNDAINDMSMELYHMRISLKSLTNENTRIKLSNQLLSDRNALLETQFAEFEKMRVECQVAKDDLLIVLKREESIKAQLAKEQETIARWTNSKNVATNIIKSQGVDTFYKESTRKDKKKLDVESLGDDTSTDSKHPLEGNASTDSRHLLLDNTSTEVTCPKRCTSNVSHDRLEKLNKKYGPTSKNFVQGSSSKTKAENVNIGCLSNKQLKDRVEEIEVKAGVKKKKNIMGYIKNLWYLDSGCSRHMTGDSTLLIEFLEKAGPRITFGDDNKGFTKGYGLISKDNVIIDQVALVDGLKHNLLSISQLCDKGFSVSFNQGACVVSSKENNNVVLTGYRKGNVYIADFNSTSADSITCFLSKASKDESWLWHI